MRYTKPLLKPVDIYAVYGLSHLIDYYARHKDDPKQVKIYLDRLEEEDPCHSSSVTKHTVQWARMWLYCNSHKQMFTHALSSTTISLRESKTTSKRWRKNLAPITQ